MSGESELTFFLLRSIVTPRHKRHPRNTIAKISYLGELPTSPDLQKVSSGKWLGWVMNDSIHPSKKLSKKLPRILYTSAPLQSVTTCNKLSWKFEPCRFNHGASSSFQSLGKRSLEHEEFPDRQEHRITIRNYSGSAQYLEIGNEYFERFASRFIEKEPLSILDLSQGFEFLLDPTLQIVTIWILTPNSNRFSKISIPRSQPHLTSQLAILLDSTPEGVTKYILQHGLYAINQLDVRTPQTHGTTIIPEDTSMDEILQDLQHSITKLSSSVDNPESESADELAKQPPLPFAEWDFLSALDDLGTRLIAALRQKEGLGFTPEIPETPSAAETQSAPPQVPNPANSLRKATMDEEVEEEGMQDSKPAPLNDPISDPNQASPNEPPQVPPKTPQIEQMSPARRHLYLYIKCVREVVVLPVLRCLERALLEDIVLFERKIVDRVADDAELLQDLESKVAGVPLPNFFADDYSAQSESDDDDNLFTIGILSRIKTLAIPPEVARKVCRSLRESFSSLQIPEQFETTGIVNRDQFDIIYSILSKLYPISATDTDCLTLQSLDWMMPWDLIKYHDSNNKSILDYEDWFRLPKPPTELLLAKSLKRNLILLSQDTSGYPRKQEICIINSSGKVSSTFTYPTAIMESITQNTLDIQKTDLIGPKIVQIFHGCCCLAVVVAKLHGKLDQTNAPMFSFARYRIDPDIRELSYQMTSELVTITSLQKGKSYINLIPILPRGGLGALSTYDITPSQYDFGPVLHEIPSNSSPIQEVSTLTALDDEASQLIFLLPSQSKQLLIDGTDLVFTCRIVKFPKSDDSTPFDPTNLVLSSSMTPSERKPQALAAAELQITAHRFRPSSRTLALVVSQTFPLSALGHTSWSHPTHGSIILPEVALQLDLSSLSFHGFLLHKRPHIFVMVRDTREWGLFSLFGRTLHLKIFPNLRWSLGQPFSCRLENHSPFMHWTKRFGGLARLEINF